MSIIVKAAALVLGLIISAHARLNAVVIGRPLSVSVLDLIALAVVLTLAAAVLYLAWLIMRERPQPAPQPVYVVTNLR